MIFFVILLVLVFLAQIIELFIPPLEWMYNAHIYIVPLVVFYGAMALPFPLMLALATFAGFLLDVLTMLGFVILIGTIVNNPILIVHQALNYIRNDGMDHRRAIALSTQTRVRPIFMSVITSVAGMAS